ncbi:hypothetical protein DTI93_04680 [Parasaccharibacter sp. TMW 2.1884]|nr:hypothetical protein [Parasaccharibacter sp. TMW 2.1884]MCL1515714.1 hypothetical protein [Parasaccharibacter sp. TMW2.1890]
MVTTWRMMLPCTNLARLALCRAQGDSLPPAGVTGEETGVRVGSGFGCMALHSALFAGAGPVQNERKAACLPCLGEETYSIPMSFHFT